MTNSGAGLASARLAAAAGTADRSAAARWMLSVMSDPGVRRLPRHPGLELLFAFELCRHGIRLATRRILADAYAIRRGRARRARCGDERRIALCATRRPRMESASARCRTAATCTTNPEPAGSGGGVRLLGRCGGGHGGRGALGRRRLGDRVSGPAAALSPQRSWRKARARAAPAGTSSATGSGSSRRSGYVRPRRARGRGGRVRRGRRRWRRGIRRAAAVRASSEVVGSEPSAASTGPFPAEPERRDQP